MKELERYAAPYRRSKKRTKMSMIASSQIAGCVHQSDALILMLKDGRIVRITIGIEITKP